MDVTNYSLGVFKYNKRNVLYYKFLLLSQKINKPKHRIDPCAGSAFRLLPSGVHYFSLKANPILTIANRVFFLFFF